MITAAARSRYIGGLVVATCFVVGCANEPPSPTAVKTSIPTSSSDPVALDFEVIATGMNYAAPSPEPRVIDTSKAEVAAAWSERSEKPVPAVKAGSLTVVVDTGLNYRNTKVVGIAAEEGTWTVLVRAHSAAECAGLDVVASESYLVAVNGAEPPERLDSEIDLAPGCGDR